MNSPLLHMVNARGIHTINYLYHVLVVITDVFAFVAAYITKSMKVLMYVHCIGIGMTMLIIVPDWKFWSRPPLKDGKYDHLLAQYQEDEKTSK